jgi:hypothetical protein
MEVIRSWRNAVNAMVCISTMRRSPSQMAPLSGSKRNKRRKSSLGGYLKLISRSFFGCAKNCFLDI